MIKEQNFKNHVRLSWFFHGLIISSCLAAIVCSAVNFSRTIQIEAANVLPAVVLLLISTILLLLAFAARGFGLKAQDRAIRAEENLRYYAITGDLPDRNLRLGQIIALRFAPNNELVDLAERAVKENLAPKEIKKAIKNWKGDHHRV